MNLPLVIHILGLLLVVLAGAMLPSVGIALYFGEPDLGPFILSILATVIAGLGLRFVALRFRRGGKSEDVGPRDGFAIVTLGWILSALFGCLPFLLADTFGSGWRQDRTFDAFFLALTDSFFETMSGFTTTGASVMMDFQQPHGIMFWRSLTHWLGGMGIILLSIAILPFLGVGGMQLYRAEVPGVVKDRIRPRIADTAKSLWLIYAFLTLVETLLLWLHPQMSLFDAVCHAFGTMATGGFSTKPESVGHYDSAYIHYVIIFFMFAAGVSFALHYRAQLGLRARNYWKDEELRTFLGLIVAITVILFVALIGEAQYVGAMSEAFRDALFQVISIITTTGYVSRDYEAWPVLPQFLLFLLMFVGGCAGSTGGGMKVGRLMLTLKAGHLEVQRLLQPRLVKHVHLGGRPVSDSVLASVVGFLVLYLVCFCLGVVLMSALGLEFKNAVTSVAATIGNIGPGLGDIGPTDHYGWIRPAGKWVLSFMMLLGRLEFYSVLVLLIPRFWRT